VRLDKILFSDEAYFWLNGYVNKQNCHIRAEEQPEEVKELPLHPDKTTVWCSLWARSVHISSKTRLART